MRRRWPALTMVCSPGSGSSRLAATQGQHHGSDHGHQQDDGGELERQQVFGEQLRASQVMLELSAATAAALSAGNGDRPPFTPIRISICTSIATPRSGRPAG
jgi:hypothetical protein